MNNDLTSIPRIINLGLFDFKLKYGAASCSERRLVRAFEIELPVDNGGLSYIDTSVYPIENDRIICAKPGQWRKTKAPFNCMYIHVLPNDGEICKILTSLPDTIKLENSDAFRALFYEIITEYTRNSHSFNLLLYSKFLALIHELHTKSNIDAPPTVRGREVAVKAIEEVINYIDENYMNKITLSDLAEMSHFSPIYFHKLFYDTTGVTPYNYILDKRIEKAKQLLSITNIPISDIAACCGFTDQAYFGKVFKTATGTTPLKFRKQMNEMYP